MKIYFDAEWVPITYSYRELNERAKSAWDKLHRARYEKYELTSQESYEQKAGFHAEFSKLLCISVGAVQNEEFKTHSFTIQKSEKELLTQFADFINKLSPQARLIGKGIKNYDIPFITKRFIKHKITVPRAWRVWEQKPWETQFIDIQDIYANGAYSQGLVSLDLICNFLGIETPKHGIDGSRVKEVYYKDNDLLKIVKYCERDVKATWEVYKRLTQ